MYCDGALLANNPTAIAIHEARAIYPEIPIEVVLSIGTGNCAENMSLMDKNKEDSVEKSKTFPWIGKNSILQHLINGATNTEAIQDVLADFLPNNTYYRFNPDIEPLPIDETNLDKLHKLKKVVDDFFLDSINQNQLDQLVAALKVK